MQKRALLLAGCLALSVSVPAQARVRTGFRDFDQKWNDLPNKGKMYCVPTSYNDVMEYMDEHGMSAMGLMDNYGDTQIWSNIMLLGVLLGTDAYTGTSGSSSFMASLMSSRTSKLLVHTTYGAGSEWGINTLKALVNVGAVNRLGVGFYYLLPTPYGDRWVRDGGHAVVLAGYDYNSSPKRLRIIDPATDEGDKNNQSNGSIDYRNTRNLTLTTWQYGQLTHAEFGAGPDSKTRYWIDGVHSILPCFAGWYEYAFKPGGSLEPIPTIVTNLPWHFTDQARQVPSTFAFTPREPIVDWTYDVFEFGALYATRTGKVYRVDLQTGIHTLLFERPGIRSLLAGGTKPTVYAMSDNGLTRFDALRGSTSTVPLSRRPEAMAYDPVSGGPVLLDGSLGWMDSYNEGLRSFTRRALPPLLDGSEAKPLFRVAGDGSVYLGREGSSTILVISRDPRVDGPRTWRIPVQKGLRDLVPTENGRVVIQDGDILATLAGDGSVMPSQLDGLTVGSQLRLPRSHRLAEASWENSPAFRQELPFYARESEQ